MISEQKLSSLIDALYSAAGDLHRWEIFLSQLAALSKSPIAAILLHDSSNSRHNVNLSSNVHPEALRLYDQHYGFKDEWFLRARSLSRTGWTAASEQFCPTAELERTEFYNDFLRHFDMHHQCGTVVEHKGKSIAHLSILRGHRDDSFGDAEIKLLRTLVPHAQRALLLHRRIMDLNLISQANGWILDQVQFGIVLFHEDGRVLQANRMARRLGVRGNGLVLSSAGLHAESPQDERNLQATLALARRRPSPDAAGRQLLISRNNPTPLAVSVVPLRDNATYFAGAAVAAFISDPVRQDGSSESFLSLFGLTPAEQRLAISLSRGNSLKDSTEELGIEISTARSQLKSIFRKTGTNRQSELIRLLYSLPPA